MIKVMKKIILVRIVCILIALISLLLLSANNGVASSNNGAPRVNPWSPLHDPPSPKATARSSARPEGRHHAEADNKNIPPRKIAESTAKADEDKYIAVPGLIDLRSTFSDGAHSVEELVIMARSRGFRAVFINDHNSIALAYGLPPFRNILRYKKQFPSIMTNGPKNFIEEIKRVSERYSDMIIFPGCETSPYYYWTGSWFSNNLTAHEYDRRILILNLNHPDDYGDIPSLHNRMTYKYFEKLLPDVLFFIPPFIIGLFLLRHKGFSRVIGICLSVFSLLYIIDHNPFRSSLITQYDGDQGITPYQEVIDYVSSKGGLTFWNYPEQRSGIRKYGSINVNTPPYPQVLYQSKAYTGFAAIYGDNITVTNPGNEWDRVLLEYCEGQRDEPVWGISTADFHKDGRLGLKLGAFPTTFLVREFSKKGIVEAIKNGRMYCSRGDGETWPVLKNFNVFGKNTKKACMGESIITKEFPVIWFRVEYNKGDPRDMKLSLIRGGKIIKSIEGKTPIEFEYVDEKIDPGRKTYYRIIDKKKHLTSNPIFIKYLPNG
jgi:hypothetical protein